LGRFFFVVALLPVVWIKFTSFKTGY